MKRRSPRDFVSADHKINSVFGNATTRFKDAFLGKRIYKEMVHNQPEMRHGKRVNSEK